MEKNNIEIGGGGFVSNILWTIVGVSRLENITIVSLIYPLISQGKFNNLPFIWGYCVLFYG